MKLASLVAAAVIAAPALALAQEKDPGGGKMIFVDDGDGPVILQGPGEGGVMVAPGGPAMADRLKEALGLTDDQYARVQKIDEETRSEMQKLHDDPSFDPSKIRDVIEKSRDKVKTLLTDEQKTKFDQQKGPRMLGGGKPLDPAARDRQLLERAEKDLKLGADEKAVVLPLVKKLIDARTAARQAQDKRRKELAQFLKDVPGTTDAQKGEIAAKIKDLRRARADDEAKLKAAADALREVLTPENEGALMTLGVLDF